jgi:hypothetical protein
VVKRAPLRAKAAFELRKARVAAAKPAEGAGLGDRGGKGDLCHARVFGRRKSRNHRGRHSAHGQGSVVADQVKAPILGTGLEGHKTVQGAIGEDGKDGLRI